MLLNLQISISNINFLKSAFDIDSNVLKTDFDLIKNNVDLPNNKNVNIEKWIKWLLELCCRRKIKYFNIFKIIKICIAISIIS